MCLITRHKIPQGLDDGRVLGASRCTLVGESVLCIAWPRRKYASSPVQKGFVNMIVFALARATYLQSVKGVRTA